MKTHDFKPGDVVMVDGDELSTALRQHVGYDRLATPAIVKQVSGGRIGVAFSGETQIFWFDWDVFWLVANAVAELAEVAA